MRKDLTNENTIKIKRSKRIMDDYRQQHREMTEEEIDYQIDLLEDKLKEIHAKDYHGLDDDMPDDYQRWRSELTNEEVEELVKY